jgi:ribulose-5-phosphate 4-epimerase/fuculose-1-phosphate aldolase
MLDAYQKMTNKLVRRVNDQRGMGSHVREAMVSRKVAQMFLEHLRLAAERGLSVGKLSEASLRLSGDKFLITAVSCYFPISTEKELKIGAISADWTIDLEEMPRHAAWHREIYGATDAKAILLSQPTAAMALAAKGELPAAGLLVDGETAVNGLIHTPPDAAQISTAAKSNHALLIAGYGLITLGDDLGQAISRAEIVNRCCQITLQLE